MGDLDSIQPLGQIWPSRGVREKDAHDEPRRRPKKPADNASEDKTSSDDDKPQVDEYA